MKPILKMNLKAFFKSKDAAREGSDCTKWMVRVRSVAEEDCGVRASFYDPVTTSKFIFDLDSAEFLSLIYGEEVYQTLDDITSLEPVHLERLYERFEHDLVIEARESVPIDPNSIEMVDKIDDIEDLLMKRIGKTPSDPIAFSCTSCGECCRSRDMIMLTPLDLYSISRASSLGSHQLYPTRRIYKHPTYKNAFHFDIKDNLPICHLRPAHAIQGQCHFAYPLLKHIVEGKNGEKDREELMTSEETEEYLTFYQGQNEFKFETMDEDSDDEKDELWETMEKEMEERFKDMSPVSNSFGRQSLGCVLGRDDMPTLCLSYPFIPGIEDKDVHNCTEGFIEENVGKRPGVSITEEEIHSNKDVFNKSVGDYLDEKDFMDKWREMVWFQNLKNELNSHLTFLFSNDRYEEVQQHFQEVIRRVWYDFDSIAAARRPIRTYSRLKREIESCSWAIVQTTKVYLDNLQHDVKEWIIADYKELVGRLNIIK